MNHESVIVIAPSRSQKEDRQMDTRHVRYDWWITRAAGITIALALLGGPACLQAAQSDKPATNDQADKDKPVKPVKERREPDPDIDDPPPPPPDIGPDLPELRIDRQSFKQDKHRHKERSLGKVAPERIDSHPQQVIHVLLSEKDGKKDKVKEKN